MKHNKITTALLIQGLLFCGSAFAQSTLDFSARHMLNKSLRASAKASTMSTGVTPETLLPVTITLENEDGVDEIEALGVTPTASEKNIVFARVTREQLSKIAELKGVRKIGAQKKRRLLLHNARLAGDVDMAHNGSNGIEGVTGKNVLVGIVDGGFDPNHIAFRTSDQSELRVKRLSHYKSDDNGVLTGVDVYEPSDFSGFTSDDSEDYHATHVTGIAAGAYSGVYNGKSFQGVAPDAAIYMAALYNYSDDELIKASQDIRDYAKENGMPAVINMSLGYNLGPHDGTDAFNVALDEIAREIPVCIAAGNEADLDISIIKTLTASDNTVRTSFTPNSDLKAENKNYQVASAIDIWSDDDTPFDVNVLIVDKSTGAVKYTYPVKTTYQEVTPNSSIYNTNYSFIESQKGLESNGRYYASVYMELLTKSSTWTTYPAIEVIGKAGQTIRVYNDGYYTDFSTKRFSGYDAATPDGTINDMACGKNVIAVGAYNANVSGYPWTEFSSYGTLCDGRELPHVCAPGEYIISAMSTPYYNASYATPSATFTVNGKKYYYGEMSGTSMATPYMTGTAAVWLQANPNLSPNEIREIAKETAVAPQTPDVKWGAGRVNVLDGVKKAFEMSGCIGVSPDAEEAVIINRISDAEFEVYTPLNENPEVTVYDISGRVIKTVAGTGSSAVVNLSDCSKGIYILNARGDGKSISRKISL